jgi:PAS domain S-box-containing protein
MLNSISADSSPIRREHVKQVLLEGDWEINLNTGISQWSEFVFSFFELIDRNPINFFKSNQYYSADDTIRLNKIANEVIEKGIISEGVFRVTLPSGKIAWHHSIFQLLNSDSREIEVLHVTHQDITSQVKLGQKIFSNHPEYNHLIHHLQEIVFQLDAEGCISFVNDIWQQTTLYTKEETIGKPFKGWVHSHDLKKVEAIFKNLSEKAVQNIEDEIRLIDKEGEFVWVSLRLNNTGIETKALSFFGSMLNINQQKKSTALILKQQLAIENSREGIAIMNNNDQYTYLNRAHIELFGYSDESEFLGQSWRFIYPPDEIERISNEVFPEFIAKGYYKGATRGLKKDGTFLYQDICLTSLPDGGLMCITRDISDVVKKNEELYRLAIVAEKTNSIVMIGDDKGRVEWVNDSFTEITGFQSAEIIGRRPDEVLNGTGTSQETQQEIINSIQKGTGFQGEILSYKKDGSPIWFLIDVAPIFNSMGRLVNFVAVENDITLLKQAESNTISALEKERQLNQFKSHFINLASHEFRTPLATIQSSMDILKLRMQKEIQTTTGFKESFFQHHSRIEQEIKWMTEVMNNILVLGKTDAGRLNLKQEKICMNELIKDVMIDKVSVSEGKDTFKMEIRGECYYMYLDPQLMRHVVYNLMSNALKYTLSDREPEILINYLPDELHIHVKDYGIGIPDLEMQHLFTSFFRASNTINIQGIGLGLVIVKQLVEMHGGRVQVTSKYGRGTEFIVVLPKEQIDDEKSTNC